MNSCFKQSYFRTYQNRFHVLWHNPTAIQKYKESNGAFYSKYCKHFHLNEALRFLTANFDWLLFGNQQDPLTAQPEALCSSVRIKKYPSVHDESLPAFRTQKWQSNQRQGRGNVPRLTLFLSDCCQWSRHNLKLTSQSNKFVISQL